MITRSNQHRRFLQKTTGISQPETAVGQLLDLAAKTVVLAVPGGTKKFLREMKQYIAQRPEATKLKSTNLSKALYYAKKRKMIRLIEQGDRVTLELTEKGRRHCLRYAFATMSVKAPARWDGQWRLLLFDIPEKRKIAREALRHQLKRIGFIQFQKSVWIFPYPCQDEIDFLADIFSIGRHLSLLTVTIDDDRPLRSYFKL